MTEFSIVSHLPRMGKKEFSVTRRTTRPRRNRDEIGQPSSIKAQRSLFARCSSKQRFSVVNYVAGGANSLAVDFDGTFVTSLIGLESVGHVAGPLERVHALTAVIAAIGRGSPSLSLVNIFRRPECNPPAAEVVKLLHRMVIALCLSVVVREEFTSLQNPNIASVRKL